MPENYDPYITKNIKALYKRRLFSPLVYLLLLIILWNVFSLTDLLFPVQPDASATFKSLYDHDTTNIHVTITDLKFTGYTRNSSFGTSGYYYYTMHGDSCVIVLLSPSTCEEGLPSISSVTFTGKIKRTNESFDTLLTHLSEDLNWTPNGIKSKVPPYFLSEPDYKHGRNMLLFTVIFATAFYALLCTVAYLIFIAFPFLSPCCQDLALFGNPKKLLAQAEEELATLPQLATEDMFITEHFFIETSVYGNAIVPIDQIIWIYKYSTLHKFFWYHFSISYTLHISANKHLYIQCPKNLKSDIDGIMDYLAEANHNILVGFNEKNRLAVQKIQGTPMNFEKFISFLKKRI